MTELDGDLPGFEEAMRVLFADELERFKSLLAAWPDDGDGAIDTVTLTVNVAIKAGGGGGGPH